MVLNIVSLNVRGLREVNKQREVFQFYRNKCHVLCLQETHSCIEDEKIWEAEWGGKIFFSHGEKNSRGVATLINKNYPEKVCAISSAEGRIVECEINNSDRKYSVLNVYAPNKDSPKFFTVNINKAYEKK